MKHKLYFVMFSAAIAMLNFTASAATVKPSTIVCVTDPCPGRSTEAVAALPTSVDSLGPRGPRDFPRGMVTVKSVDAKARTVAIEENGKRKILQARTVTIEVDGKRKILPIKDGATPPVVGSEYTFKDYWDLWQRCCILL